MPQHSTPCEMAKGHVMGKHSTPKGEKSTSEKMTGKRDQVHVAKHAAKEKPAGSDVPPRGQGIK